MGYRYDPTKRTYRFAGAVAVYDKIATTNFKTTTRATSKEKAASNIKFQFTQANNLIPRTKITLIGDIVAVG